MIYLVLALVIHQLQKVRWLHVILPWFSLKIRHTACTQKASVVYCAHAQNCINPARGRSRTGRE
jgi:hypothetical protein